MSEDFVAKIVEGNCPKYPPKDVKIVVSNFLERMLSANLSLDIVSIPHDSTASFLNAPSEISL